MTPRQPEAGVTLVEMLVALALFALIASAGFTLLDQVLRSQRATEGRLEALSSQQRALHLVLADLMLASPRSLQSEGAALRLTRDGVALRYGLEGDVLRRSIGGADQALVTGVESLSWRFLAQDGTWSETWPPEATLTTPANPRAIELVIGLGAQKELRRLAALPVDPS